MRILVADDEEVHRELICRIASGLGHETTEAKDGAEALRLLGKVEARIVISDWVMPEMDGLQLCDAIRLRGEPDYVYFILVSGRKTSTREYRDAMGRGVDDFLRKPINNEELTIRIRVAERILSLTQRLGQLEALMPICMYCKDIRVANDRYEPLDKYIADRSKAKFTHGICPKCLKVHFPAST